MTPEKKRIHLSALMLSLVFFPSNYSHMETGLTPKITFMSGQSPIVISLLAQKTVGKRGKKENCAAFNDHPHSHVIQNGLQQSSSLPLAARMKKKNKTREIER